MQLTKAQKFEVSVLTAQSSEFDKYNAFLKEVLRRCANLKQPYDRRTKLPLTFVEIDKFCDAAASLGLPVVALAEDYYAAYPTFEMLYKIEKWR